MRTKTIARMFTLSAACLCLATPADTITNSINTSVIVLSNCNMSGGSIQFGSYDPAVVNAKVPLDATGAFTISCAKGVTATLALNAGQNSAHAIGTQRAMASGGDYLSYDLYTSPSYSTVWSLQNTVNYVSSSKNTVSTETVWARIPAGQNKAVSDKNYSDTVTITATF